MRDSSIINFPHYGIHFTDNNWLLSFEDIIVTGNGHSTVNSAGIYKNPSIIDLVDVRFTGMTIEENGSASSVAGGVNLQTISPDVSKGITFRNSTIEGNFGSLDVYVDSSDHFVIDDVYIESTGNTSGIELKKCIGVIKNSRISSDPGNTGKAIFVNTNSETSIDGNTLDTDYNGGGHIG